MPRASEPCLVCPTEDSANAGLGVCSNVMIIATGTRPALDPLGPFSVDYQVTHPSLIAWLEGKHADLRQGSDTTRRS